MNANDECIVGSYRLGERLGEGGMGEVYHAVDTMLEREVALKMLRPEMSSRAELVERFRVEAIALARLNHRNIAAVYAFFHEGERHHMAMQYVRGRTLEAVLRERRRLPWQEAAAVTIDVLLALEHAHALGVIHRDLKPANLMIDTENRTVVMDFGIARVLERGRQTREGTLVGTLEYIAPEIVKGQCADARSDLYALGCVLYEMVTGELPFDAHSDFELMRAHAEQAPLRPGARTAELPKALEDIILRALAKQPDARFQTAADFRLALVGAAEEARPADESERRTQAQQAALKTVFPAPGEWIRKVWRWLDLPSSGGWPAWRGWLRGNPGLAGAALVVSAALTLVVGQAGFQVCCVTPLALTGQTHILPAAADGPAQLATPQPGSQRLPQAAPQTQALVTMPTPASPAAPEAFAVPVQSKPRARTELPVATAMPSPPPRSPRDAPRVNSSKPSPADAQALPGPEPAKPAPAPTPHAPPAETKGSQAPSWYVRR